MSALFVNSDIAKDRLSQRTVGSSKTSGRWVKSAAASVACASIFAATATAHAVVAYADFAKKTGHNFVKFDTSPSSVEQDLPVSHNPVKVVIDAYSMSVSELSRIVGVSRQAVHDWLKGSVPTDENLAKIGLLELIADRILSTGTKPSSRHLKRVLGSTGSVMDSLAAGSDIEPALTRLLEVLAEEQVQRVKLAKNLRGAALEMPTENFGLPYFGSRHE